MHRPDLLPDTWVSAIFTKLTVRYGSEFAGRYRDVEPLLLQRDWAEQLAGFRTRHDCIKYALDNLPARAPNVAEFRALCNAAPEPVVAALPAPKPDPQRVAEELRKLRQPSAQDFAGMKGWAYRLKAREDAGAPLSSIQRRYWREALGEAA